ncbi:MAG: 16S rRNA (cytosine(1402)-N(4))-methyltransferase RsmH [Nitrospirae bacterium]|nr:16S rRNA (cytosine(1402)-N(4))-methyltransferase RsmH [Nitrospirota bacterium]
MAAYHKPVMVREVMEILNVSREGTYVDATVGGGGHADVVLGALGPSGRLIAMDRDSEAISAVKERLRDRRVCYVRENFSRMESAVKECGCGSVDGILMDLGLSMIQLRDMERGFSFESDHLLDMRMDRSEGLSAWDVVNTFKEVELEKILRQYGEEPRCRAIARAIGRSRQKKTIDNCRELAGLVARIYGKYGRTHPATRTFQALRVYVNGEIDSLSAALGASLGLLRTGGRLCVISYHSLEDRVAKHFFKDGAREGTLSILTKKPMIPSPQEQRDNPSSRSAKLRGGFKL